MEWRHWVWPRQHPVKLYSATESSTLDLDMLDKNDLSNIKFKRVNAKTGKEVKWENIIKGYKLDDRYIVLNDEDFDAAQSEKNKLFSIQQFVNEEEIEASISKHLTSWSPRNMAKMLTSCSWKP